MWLPSGVELRKRGTIDPAARDSVDANQFMTIAGDGQVCAWDIRYEEIAKKSKALKNYKEGDEIPWNPACTFGLHKLEGGGMLEMSAFSFEDTRR